MVPLREILLVLTDSFLPKVGFKVSVDPVTLISTNSLNFFCEAAPMTFLTSCLALSGSYVKENPGKSVIFSPSSLMPLQFWAKTLVGMGRRYSFRVEPLCIGLCCNVLFTQLVLC